LLLRTLLLSGASTLLIGRRGCKVVVKAPLIVAVAIIIVSKILNRRELLVELVGVVRSCARSRCGGSVLTVRTEASESRVEIILTSTGLFIGGAAKGVGTVVVPVRTTQTALSSLVLLERRSAVSREGSRDVLPNTSRGCSEVREGVLAILSSG
jgi:hypothetical protein